MSKGMILVIEDEKNIVEVVKYSLEQEGFQVLTAFQGDTGLDEAIRKKPDLILLDLMLPELDGIEICKILKQNAKTSPIPIIMLTAKSEETDQVLGLELGADDYVTKPFSPRQLVARVKAVLRRVREKPKDRIYKAGKLELDTGKHLVRLQEKPVQLSAMEYALLNALFEASGRALSREYLLEHVWGYARATEVETRTIDMHVGQLRKKLKAEARRIITVKNLGYRLDDES